MEDWVQRALARWPNVPALFGWLSLDRRGRWRIRGQAITRAQIIETINRNYAADRHGRWFFQNGPQRGYMQLEYAPLVLRSVADPSTLRTHTNLPVTQLQQVYLDEYGNLLLVSEQGPGLLAETELEWALQCLYSGERAVSEEAIEAALALPGGTVTGLEFSWNNSRVPVVRLDATAMPDALGFVRDPQPLQGERAAHGEAASD